MESRCVECGELKADPEEFYDGLRCIECYSVAEEKACFSVNAHSEHEKACFVDRSNGRLDLVHEGRPTEKSMLIRQATFLSKQGRWPLREMLQARSYVEKYMPMRYGWTT